MERKEGLPIYWRAILADRLATWTRVEEDGEGHEADEREEDKLREDSTFHAEALGGAFRITGPHEYLSA